MAQVKQFIFVLGHTLVAAYVVLLLTVSVIPVKAQTVMQYQITAIDKRVGMLEGLNLDRRIAVLENIAMNLHDNNTMHQLTMGGTGLLMLERIYRAVRRAAVDGETKE